jgi:hypothetical protein
MKHSQLLGHPNMKASHFKMIFKSVLTLSFALMILLLAKLAKKTPHCIKLSRAFENKTYHDFAVAAKS